MREKEKRKEEWKRAKDNRDEENMASLLRDTFKEAIDKEIAKGKASWRGKNWFDGELREKRREVSEMKRWGRRTEWSTEGVREQWKRKRNE